MIHKFSAVVSGGRFWRKQVWLGALSALLLSGTAAAQAPAAAPADTAFVRLMRKNQTALTAAGTQFSGPGWDKLQQDIRKSALVLVGEDHGMAEIPAFTQALAQVLQPKVYVAEIDRYQARDLTRLVAQPGPPTAFLQQYPMNLSFYSWAEEFELARALRARGTALVGVEQVGFATPGRLLGLMADETKSKPARLYLRQQAAALQAHDRAALVAGNYGAISINALRPGLLDSLRTLTRQDGPAVQQMLRDLEASGAIFKTNAAGKPGGHQARINLMKRNLLAELQPYQVPGQPLPPMLFKFGANHLGRGRSIWGDIYDVGNLAVNLADAHDQKTLHIFIIGKQGRKVTGQNPADFSKNSSAYSMADEAMLRPFMAATPAGAAWQVFDVRPLRRAMLYQGLPVPDQELQATLLGYDYVVIIPETAASRNL
ncbi:hypothetical protein [Hymenobacter jeollabukensis]|uniref:Haem-binding uptake Tiki superfamily ChaN domain-containing protein n=1 Tax=Hymenobacter jeollabukensis TaxID=2025313 RepID=A0A5R8WVW6_9BACT|nr:hypothetical protein [Hymenobacter jeollabukensis]TLM96596.1 hypothetical protein FDY95_00970 [Hymenobacter jeollabukensis]